MMEKVKQIRTVTPAKAGVHLAAFAKTYKWIPACAGMTIFLCLTSLPAQAADQKESAYERVIRTGELRCGYGISPPSVMKDPNTGKVSGLDYDIWQEIGKELDLKVEFTEEAGWGNFIEGLKTGRYDAFCSEMWADAPRTKYLSLTIPVMYSSLKAFVLAGDFRFDGDLEKINAPEVALPVIEGDISETFTKNAFPDATIHYLPQTATLSDMFLAVKSKKADVLFLNKAMADDLEKANPGVLREIADVSVPFTFGSYYGFRSGEIQLRDMVNVALQKLIDDGRIEKLAKKYSDELVAPAKNYPAGE